MTDWVYPDYFDTLTAVANWVALSSVLCCVFLLLSWAFLPVDKTNRHYLSICLTIAVLLMNVSSSLPGRRTLVGSWTRVANKVVARIRHPVGCSAGSML